MSTATIAAPAATPTVDNQNLVNNLLTNLAPLIALLGDEVTKQFLSTSLGVGDNILIATAPVGLFAIAIGAIRVGGSRFMKSFIGRARDSPDDEERDLLSSTSAFTCELWNGKRVIRQTRPAPQMIELVYGMRESLRGYVFEAPVCTLADAIQGNPINGLEPLYEVAQPEKVKNVKELIAFMFYPNSAKLSAIEEGSQMRFRSTKMLSTKDEVDLMAIRAPNLTLNLPNAIPDPYWVWVFAAVGILLQIAVFTINALVVYYLAWQRGNYLVASYGYPCWAAGTASLMVGVYLCARVIRTSTVEYVFRPKVHQKSLSVAEEEESRRSGSKEMKRMRPIMDNGSSDFRVVRLQREDRKIKLSTYAIYNHPRDPCIRVSRRIWPRMLLNPFEENPTTGESQEQKLAHPTSHPRFAFFSALGAGMIVVGFIFQNIGTRELHWSAGALQLAATVVLAGIRALLRRHLGDSPSRVMALRSGFTASHLACDIRGVSSWEMVTGVYDGPILTGPAPGVQMPSKERPSKFATHLGSLVDVHKVPRANSIVYEMLRGSHTFWNKLDSPAIMALRVLQSHRQIASITQDKDEIDDVGSRVCKAISEIVRIFSIDKFEWRQNILVRATDSEDIHGEKEAMLDQVVGIELGFLKTDDDGPSVITTFTQKQVTAILGLTMFHRSTVPKKDDDIPSEAKYHFAHIVGYCKKSQADAKYMDILKWYLADKTLQWTRSISGEIEDLDDPSDHRNFSTSWASGRIDPNTVFGLPYSSLPLYRKGLGEEQYIEFVIVPENFESLLFSESSLLIHIALDFLATFLLILVRERKGIVQAKAWESISKYGGEVYNHRTQKNSLLDMLCQVLVDNELTSTKAQAKDFIIPAFVANEIAFPEPENKSPENIRHRNFYWTKGQQTLDSWVQREGNENTGTKSEPGRLRSVNW